MLLVIDNYDSFTYNLVQYFGELGSEAHVIRNDELGLEEIEALRPERIVISPGPCTPAEAGVSIEVVRRFGSRIPLLGVCLGHQAVAEAYGGRTIRAARVMHGKTTPVRHSGQGLFQGIPTPVTVARYHSLVTDPEALPTELTVEAWSDGESGSEIQAIAHVTHPVWGVQFHPESWFSQHGKALLTNFLSLG